MYDIYLQASVMVSPDNKSKVPIKSQYHHIYTTYIIGQLIDYFLQILLHFPNQIKILENNKYKYNNY